VSVHGARRYLRSDNGPEFVAAAILRWLAEARIDTGGRLFGALPNRSGVNIVIQVAHSSLA
jgi:hypothetical protein